MNNLIFLPSASGIIIYTLFFIGSMSLETKAFASLSENEKNIVMKRRKLPFFTNFQSAIKVYTLTLVVIVLSVFRMPYKTFLYHNSQDLVFQYRVFMVFFLLAAIPIIKFLQRDIRDSNLPNKYLSIILTGDYIHLWGILIACYLSIPGSF